MSPSVSDLNAAVSLITVGTIRRASAVETGYVIGHQDQVFGAPLPIDRPIGEQSFHVEAQALKQPAHPTAALAGRHQQADFAQMARPARLAVVQAAIAQQFAALFGEHCSIAALLQGHVHQKEEEVVSRLRRAV